MKKGILILILLILALFSVSCIYAADVNDTLAASEDTGEIELSHEMESADDNLGTIEEQTVTQTDNEEKTGETDDGSFEALQSKIGSASSGDTVYLENNYSCEDSWIQKNGIHISTSNLVIDGQGHTIDAKQKTRIFYVKAENVTIKNIKFINAKYESGDGGAIYWYYSDNGCVSGCSFVNCSVAYSGGAIYWSNSANSSVSGCSFVNCSADDYGGAINGDCKAINCTFKENQAFCGGAMAGGSAVDCTFTHNSGDADGGAIFCDGGRINFFNCTFTDNSAGQGGAIKIYGGDDYHITNCIFTNNNARQGGAIFQHGHNITISNSTFTNNNAREGGAIYQNCDNVTISNSIFADNSASGYGGAIIWAYGDYGDVLNCIFTNNSSPLGCAIHLFQTRQNEFNVSKCSFVRNTGDYTIWLLSLNSFIYSKINNNIFLDNIVDSNILFNNRTSDYTNVEINADNNWFGSTASNYAQRPIDNDNIICDSWLFLNGTANPDNISVFDSSSIAFKLFKYNSSSEDITEYDNTLLLPINLTVTSTNGDVDIHTVNLGESIRYTPTGLGDASVTATIENVAWTIALNNIKANPNLSAENQVITYGENATIALNYNTNATGKVNITLTGKKGTFNYHDLDLNVTIVLPDNIPADEYNVTVSYFGDENFMNATANATLSVNKANSTLTINNNVTFDYGTNGSTTVSYTNASGVNASVVGQPNAIVVVNDTTITVSGLNAGNYILTVTTITDANHNNVTKNATITVNKLKTQLTGNAITTTYNINKDLVFTLKDANGNALSGLNVTVDLNGAKTYTTDSNGQVKVSTKGLAPKAYTAKITFNGNTKYAESSKDVKVTVKKATPKLTAKKKTFKSSVKTKKYTIVLKDNTGKAIKKAKVTLKVKGKTYKATTNSKGKATFKIKKLNKKGTYKAVIKYKGNKCYNKATKKTKIKVTVTFKTVSKGSKDKSTVRQIQQALKDNGYYLSYKGHYLMVDGKFESCTQRSVREFQQDNGLKVTGKVDEKTAIKLKII